MDIQLAVDTRLAEAMRLLPAVISRELQPALKRVAGQVARDMRRGAPKASSLLTNSIRSEMTGPLSARAIAGVQHGVYVERGTGPGGIAPRQSLLDWMQTVGLRTGDAAADNRSAYLIAGSIRRKGTRAQPFAEPARDANADKAARRMDAAIGRAIAAAGLS